VIGNAHVHLTWRVGDVNLAIEARYEDATKVRCVVETLEFGHGESKV
jgi:hypothetical protein